MMYPFHFLSSRHFLIAAALAACSLSSVDSARAEASTGFLLAHGQLTLSRQIYTPWTYDAVNKRYLALYLYRTTSGDRSFTAQMVVAYRQPDQAGKVYFYNLEKQKYWGVCDVSNPHQSAWSVFRHASFRPQANAPAIPDSTDRTEIVDPPAPPGVVPPPPAAAAPPAPAFVPGT